MKAESVRIREGIRSQESTGGGVDEDRRAQAPTERLRCWRRGDWRQIWIGEHVPDRRRLRKVASGLTFVG